VSGLSTYGYGIDIDTIGATSIFGFGISPLGPIINASIAFTTNLDIEVVNNLTAGKDLTFALDLLLSINKQLDTNPNIEFDLETAVQVATQDNVFNPAVEFNTQLGEDFINNLITEASIDLDIQLTQEQAAFLIQFILAKQNLYLIPEELRFLKVFEEQRLCEISEEQRLDTIKFEDRTVVVPYKEEN